MASPARLLNVLRVAAAKNGRVIPCDADTTSFLLACPRGAYTTARTVEQKRIFDYEGHIKRLVQSTSLLEPGSQDALDSQRVEAILRPRIAQTLRAAMNSFKEKHGEEPDQEYKITALVCHPEAAIESKPTSTTAPPPDPLQSVSTVDVYCHIGLLPRLRNTLVKLQVKGAPRDNAAAKDSGWVRERKDIYDALPEDVEEIVLMEPGSHLLLEGSQTNFYAVKNGTVFTADEGILKGTVRALVLEMCDEEGIPVVLQPPTLDAINEWDGCFISSTSRLVLGAGCLEYSDPASGAPITRAFERCSVVDRLASAVKTAVIRKSSSVF